VSHSSSHLDYTYLDVVVRIVACEMSHDQQHSLYIHAPRHAYQSVRSVYKAMAANTRPLRSQQ